MIDGMAIRLPDAMTRATLDVLDPDIGGTFAHGDAVIAGPDGASGDGHEARLLDVDAIGVRTVFWRGDLRTPYRHAGAAKDRDVEDFAVHQCQATDHDVL